MTLFPDDEIALNLDADRIANSADALLAKEMNALDLKERNALQEEAHGLKNPFFEETPEKVAKALNELSDRIEQIPPSEKKMYTRSQTIPNSHIQTKGFRLRLLRAAGFDIQTASTKLVEICDIMVDLFGEVALERPVLISDFTKKELQFLRMGRYQFLPFGDRMGRRIMIMFPDEVWEAFPPLSKSRIAFYMSWYSAVDDASQRKGIALIVWFDQEFKNCTGSSSRPKKLYPEYKVHSVRTVAIHVCTPDTPFHRLRRAVLTVRLGRSRRYARVHVGNSMENRYALQSFGIASDQIPISYTGKIKVGYHRQWIGVRRIIEESLDRTDTSSPSETIIEYPREDDVVFRQGSSCAQHAANRTFRNLILSKVQEQELSRDVSGVKIRRKKMVLDIVNEIRVKGGGRFLIWNEIGGWNELVDEEIIHSKIEYLIKEFRKTVRVDLRSRPQTILSASTSVFRSDYTMMADQNSNIPFDLQHEVNEEELLEAACCVAKLL